MNTALSGFIISPRKDEIKRPFNTGFNQFEIHHEGWGKNPHFPHKYS